MTFPASGRAARWVPPPARLVERGDAAGLDTDADTAGTWPAPAPGVLVPADAQPAAASPKMSTAAPRCRARLAPINDQPGSG